MATYLHRMYKQCNIIFKNVLTFYCIYSFILLDRIGAHKCTLKAVVLFNPIV